MQIKTELRHLPRAFITNNDHESDSEYSLSEDRSHHLSNVLRLSLGTQCILIDPVTGKYFQAEVSNTGRKLGLTRTGEDIFPDPGTRPALTLITALCKGEKNERITDWATELGVSEIIFFQAERSIVKIKDFKEKEKKQAKLSAIAEAAALQSGRIRIPSIVLWNTLSEVLEKTENLGQARLLCSLQSDSVNPATILTPSLQTLSLVVGPEGDFSETEEQKLRQRDYHPISLGPQVLRSELAVVSAITTIWHFTNHAVPDM